MSVGEVLQSGTYWDYGTLWGWQVHFDEHPGWVQVRVHRVQNRSDVKVYIYIYIIFIDYITVTQQA